MNHKKTKLIQLTVGKRPKRMPDTTVKTTRLLVRISNSNVQLGNVNHYNSGRVEFTKFGRFFEVGGY